MLGDIVRPELPETILVRLPNPKKTLNRSRLAKMEWMCLRCL